MADIDENADSVTGDGTVEPPSNDAAGIETAVGAESARVPIADVGVPAFGGVDVYSGDGVFDAAPAYSGDGVYEGQPAVEIGDAYDSPSAYDAVGAYEPEGAYTPTVTPVAAESIAPDDAVPSAGSGEPPRVDPIGVYVPDDVPAAALPQDEIAEAESSTADASAAVAEPLPESPVSPDTGTPLPPADATSGPSAVRFDD